MTLQAPSPEQILDVAIDFGLDLSQEDARSFAGLIAGSVPSYNRLDELAEPSLPVKYPRTPGHRPARARPAGHADDSVPRHGDPARRLLARGLRGAGAQHGREHLPVRRLRAPGHDRALRQGRRSAGGHDADREALRRGDGAAGGGRLRSARRRAVVLMRRPPGACAPYQQFRALRMSALSLVERSSGTGFIPWQGRWTLICAAAGRMR